MPKVIGAGFGRTGTMSLKIALEQVLETSCYHMVTVIQDRPEHIAVWRQAARGEPIDWRTMFEDYGALVDWPVARFYVELLEAFPDAKFVLTVRDPARWYESAEASIFEVAKINEQFPVSLFMAFMRRVSPRGYMSAMTNEVIWDFHFGGRFSDRNLAMAVFEQHIEDVKQHIPADQLLVFDVRDGWAPLCQFLGVEVPDGPFPRSNETAEFRRRISMMRAISWAFVAFLTIVIVAVAVAIWSLL